MTDTPLIIRKLDIPALENYLEDLCRVLIDSVEGGSAISFMAPLSKAEAESFWLNDVKTALVKRNKILLGAFLKNRLVGTVQLVVGMPPNQQHRFEISKMVVHPNERRQGLGKALMNEALLIAKQMGKTLVTLDTRMGDVSESLYQSVGFQKAGVIPDFAFDPDGKSRHATTYMYRYL
jgi:ribosomal protein S18 acetylase RimI-like enzyme